MADDMETAPLPEARLRARLEENPVDVDALYLLGVHCHRTGRSNEAIAFLRRAAERAAHRFDLHAALALILRETGDIDGAIACYRKSIEIKPTYAPAFNGMGAAYFALGNWGAALEAYSHAARLAPGDADPISNMGSAFFNLGMDDKSILCSRRAIDLAPDFVEAHFGLAVALLCSGQYKEGLAEYEWRRRLKDYRQHVLPAPEWKGEAIERKTIFLYPEQGLGDALHFARYATVLAEDYGARVVLGGFASLERVLRTVPGVADFVASGEELPPMDVHLPLLSAPFRVGTRADTIPAPPRYLSAEKEAAKAWGERLSGFTGLKVGLVWAGARTNPADARRSLRLEALSKIVAVPGCSFFSLQKGRADEETPARLGGMGIVDFTEDVQDFADTAALVENLDLVITVDTSVAHLAGAMGKPTWILTRWDNDWRWMRERDDSPWYPSVRLFRQAAIGQWDDVIAGAAAALSQLNGRAFEPTSKGKGRV